MAASKRKTDAAMELENFLDSNERDISSNIFDGLEDVAADIDGIVEKLEDKIRDLESEIEELETKLEADENDN